MIYAPNMLLIGSAGRNSGKTTFACEVIRRFHTTHPIAAAKVTTIQERDGGCPRGGEGCGVCASLDGRYCVTEENVAGGSKDTQRLLAAGAHKVYWLRVVRDGLDEGAAALLGTIGEDALAVCESNSLRRVVEPQFFLMFQHRDSVTVKASAGAVRGDADRRVVWDGRRFDLKPDDIAITDGQWVLRYAATAIILAGGKSERMGEDKSMLPVRDRPMIERLCGQLRPHFKEVLVSAGDTRKYAFLDVRVIVDELPDQGPLMGLASSLAASQCDLNLVVACDMPDINLRLVRSMLREAHDCEAVVPVTQESGSQPLFAVYRKSMLPVLRAALAEGQRDVREAVGRGRVKYLHLSDDGGLCNLNTREEYETYLSGER